MAAKQADCNQPCTGDSSQICGSASRLSLYKSKDPAKVSTNPAVPGPQIGNYTYAYCSIDTLNPRLLPIEYTGDNMSTEACIAIAEAQKAAYAGLEYGRECWIGDALAGNMTVVGNVQTRESDCNLTCVGARGEFCGAAARMNLWMRNPRTATTSASSGQ